MRLVSPKVLGLVAHYVGWLISKTVRIKLYCDPSVDFDKPYLSCFWHGKLFLPVSVMPRVGYEKRAVLVSHSQDGEILATWLGSMGYLVVRGSSSRGGMRGLVRLLAAAKKGYALAIAADGPKGPIHEVKTGVAFAAQKSGLEILPFGVEVSLKKTFLKSWDHCEFPLPFSKAVFYVEKPIKLDNNVPPEQYNQVIARAIFSAQEKAASILKGNLPEDAVLTRLDP